MDRNKDFEQIKHTEWLFVRESYNGVQFNQGRGLAGQMVANWSVWWLRSLVDDVLTKRQHMMYSYDSSLA